MISDRVKESTFLESILSIVGAVYHNCLGNRMTKKVVLKHMFALILYTHTNVVLARYANI